jgi:hypothetical protein
MECTSANNKPVILLALPIARLEPAMKAGGLRPPSTFYRMIEAHGDRALIDSFLLKRPSVSQRGCREGAAETGSARGAGRL